jgi:3-oxoacyl-[acyl-carrier protein] reductase
MDMKGKVVIVTGSSSGVGAATAEMCAEAGASVVVNYSRNVSGAETTVASCEAVGAKAVAVRADVAQDADCRKLAEAALANFDRIDYLVNSAGTTKFSPMEDLEALSAEDFLHIYRVNTVGPYQMARACVPHMRKAGRGAIVNVSSNAGIYGTGSSIAYAASKGALNTMTLSMARVFAPEIRVNAVCPGFIRGDWIRRGLGDDAYEKAKANWEATAPLGTTAEPDDIAEAIVYLLAGARVVTGETLLLNAGSHLRGSDLHRR